MIKQLLDINRGDSGAAPHKPLLLLTIIELVDKGFITENRFEPDEKFVSMFKELSAQLVGPRKTPIAHHLPFYHLQNDGFWKLNLQYGKKIKLTNKKSPSGWSSLQNAVHYASLKNELFEGLSNPDIRSSAKRLLLLTYFPQTYRQADVLLENEKQYLQSIETSFFNFHHAAEEKATYSTALRKDRDQYFQTKLPFYYQYRCAISEAKTMISERHTLLDACHIIPIDEKPINAIQNGVILSPTLHRAFDRFLISIDENYQVIVSTAFTENDHSPFNLSQFRGKRINLPENPNWYPSQEALAWHRAQLL